ncbi:MULTISPECIES: hypothetical protein [Microbacterium]|uniref:hypothetical protein n=1 Tax=Microbacterium TaxID=33882 RepID=UPI000D64D9D9|nr:MULTISPECIES: hypothetical protein [Microbacterium]
MRSTTVLPAPAVPLIGQYVPEILSLARRALLWAVLYGLFTHASRGGCTTPGDAATICYNATLNPSPVVWLVMAAIFVAALGRAAKATTTAAITRTLSRAATAMWVVPLLAAVLGIAMIMASSPDAWLHGTPPPNVTVQITTR